MEEKKQFTITQDKQLSEDLLRKHAFDLGIQSIRAAKAQAFDHEKIGDDWCPGVHIDWGVGMTTAFITGGNVVFEEGTTYTTGPVVKNWDDLDNLRFKSENKWISLIQATLNSIWKLG